MVMDFSWLPQGAEIGRLPLGMRVNNPGNIKYNPKLGYAGMLGPSSHTDQGDPQMTFDTPQNGMNAMARLVRTKYARGQRTPMSIIAGQGGWTPGNTQAAANVARTMGIDPNADLGLDDPDRMVTFLKALTLQEHGASSKLYGDDIYKAAVSGGGGGSVPAGSYLTRAIDAAATIPGVAPKPMPVAGTTGTLPGLPDLGPVPSERRKALAEALAGQAFKTAGSATNPLGALAAMAQALASRTMGSEYDEDKAARNKKLAEALLGATDNDALMRTMFASGEDDLVKAATSAKIAGMKPVTPEFAEIYDSEGRKQKVLINTRTGEYKLVGGARAASDGSEGGLYNKNLVYGEDAEGNPVPMQAGSHGEVVRSKLPEGVKLRREPVKMDGGTHWILLDPTTRQVIGQIPKDVAGEARDKEVGKGQGERMIAQPATNANMRNSLSGLDRLAKEAQSLKAMEGVEGMTGVLQGSGWVPTVRQSTADAEAKLTTLKSQIAFSVLQAMRDASKTGGALGAVSEKELALLENNLAALETQQGTPAFKGNLDRIVEYAQGAMGRLRAAYRDTYGQDFDESAGTEPPPAAQPDSPAATAPARIQSQQEYQALRRGTQYIAPDGSIRTKQ